MLFPFTQDHGFVVILIYVDDILFDMGILSECGLFGCKPVAFPKDQNKILDIADGLTYDDLARFRQLLGRLVYLTITRPELSYVIHTFSQFLQHPLQEHYDVVLPLLLYVKSNAEWTRQETIMLLQCFHVS